MSLEITIRVDEQGPSLGKKAREYAQPEQEEHGDCVECDHSAPCETCEKPGQCLDCQNCDQCGTCPECADKSAPKLGAAAKRYAETTGKGMAKAMEVFDLRKVDAGNHYQEPEVFGKKSK